MHLKLTQRKSERYYNECWEVLPFFMWSRTLMHSVLTGFDGEGEWSWEDCPAYMELPWVALTSCQ